MGPRTRVGPAQRTCLATPRTANLDIMTMNRAVADCCSAKAAYRVVLDSAPTTPATAELLFCGHHFRRHRSALAERNPIVFDTADELVGTGAVLARA